MNYKMNAGWVMMGLMILVTNGYAEENLQKIQQGSEVSFHYTLTVDSQVVDSSNGKEPLSYVQGDHKIIVGLEEEMLGLKKGDKKKVTVKPEKGYGLVDSNKIGKVSKSFFQDPKNIVIGKMVSGQINGQYVTARVANIKGDEVTLDQNHPLAGKTLDFDIEVIDVQEKKVLVPKKLKKK